MSTKWVDQKKDEFVRDVLRGFCLVSRDLEEQFCNFDRHGRLQFEVLRDMLGRETNKGLLWRLKDKAHHLFRSNNPSSRVAQLLDWGIGYIFHETIKLKEDCYQQQIYAPWFRELRSGDLSTEEDIICQELQQVITQTKQSMKREVVRIRFIMFHLRRVFPLYLEKHNDNQLLARFLVEQEELVKTIFGTGYEEMLERLYGEDRTTLHLLAAQSFRSGGWMPQAEQELRIAGKLSPKSERVLQEQKIVDTWRKRLKV